MTSNNQLEAGPVPTLPGSVFLQILAAASGNLAIVSDGMHYGWPSPSLPQLVNNTNCSKINLCMTTDEGGWMAVMPLIGAIVGSLSAACIVDTLGRKRTILATAIPFLLSWILVAVARSVFVLYTARFIAGMADGVSFTVVPMYIGEIADPRVRGLLGSSCSVTWILGFLLINIIGSFLSITNTALISAIVPVILFASFMWMPESPYYLLMRDREDEARLALKRFRKLDNVDDELERLKESQKPENKGGRGKFLELFTVPSNRKAVGIIAGLRGFQQFSGTTAFTFYMHSIFAEAGDDISPHYATIIYFTVQLLMTMFSSSLVDKVGRKPLLIISMSGSFLALILEGIYFYIKNNHIYDTSSFSTMPVVALILFVVIFSLGMQNIPILMLGELFPTDVKAFALCLADVYFSVVATIASKFLQVVREEYGIHVAFFGFAICSLLGLLFIIFFVPETKGKTLEEIQMYLKGEVKGKDVSWKDGDGVRINWRGSA